MNQVDVTFNRTEQLHGTFCSMFGSMFLEIHVDLDILADTLATFVETGPGRNQWQAIFHVEKSGQVVANMEVQIDKTYKQHLTIQRIEVHPEHRRQGICRCCVKELQTASVKAGRVAHVESVHNGHMDTLLLSEDFYPSDDGYCYEWKPLTLQSWTVEMEPSFCLYGGKGRPDVSKFQDCVAQMTDIWKESIPGMQLFSEHAKWFEPETDLEKISAELGIPLVALKDFRVEKGCFGMSSFFTEVYKDYYVIEGLAVDPSVGPLALEHACLCKIRKGKVYAFDLVRRSPLFMYGVVVRPVMKRRMSEKCKDTWAGYSVINGLNFIKNDREFWEKDMCGLVEGAMDDVTFSLKITTTMPPIAFPPPFGGRIEHKDAELVNVEVDELVMEAPDKVAYIGKTIEIYMPSPMIGYQAWEFVKGMTMGFLSDTFEYDEAEELPFKKKFECPNGRLTCSEMVELIIDFERTSGHRAHKSWFGGIDCKWVNFEGMRHVFDGVYCIVYGS